MSEPCGPHRVRRPLRAATLRGGCPFLRQRRGGAVRSGGVFGRCVRAVCSGGAAYGLRRIFASDFRVGFLRPIPVCVPACISASIAVRVSVCIGLCSGLRLGPRFGVNSSARSGPASFLPVKLRFGACCGRRRRGEGWGGAFAAQGLSKNRLPEGKRSCALKCRNRRVVPRVLSRRLCYRSLLTSCCTRGRVASGLEAGRAEPVSSLTGDAPSRLTVRLLRKTGPKFPAASFATARK